MLEFCWSCCAVSIACSGTGSTNAPAPGAKGGKKGGGGDVPVTVALAAMKDVPVEIQVIGHVEAYSTISVKAQVTGELIKANFQEGDYVKKGEPLFSIDPRPLQAALNQASANVAHDQAALGQAQANLARDAAQAQYADASASRYAQLYQEKVVSRDQTEQFRTTAAAANQAVEADKAAIESAKAAIGASQATVENARVQLGYTDIKSPIDGRTGNLHGEARQYRDGEQHGAVHHQSDRADLRNVRRSRIAVALDQGVYGAGQARPCGRSRRTIPALRRKPAS